MKSRNLRDYMKNVSIEYAHIYTNNKIDEEHHLSLQILEELKKEFGENNSNTGLVVMVDDYSFPDPSFDYESFTGWLAEKDHAPDLMIRESQLIPVCDEVLKIVSDNELKENLTDYVRAKKYPCSLFIAAWYLLRLGHIKHSVFGDEHVAEKLINVLPASFKPFEDKGLEIIASTPYADAIKNIEYKYFEGRIIA